MRARTLVLGIDVSSHQGAQLDWRRVVAEDRARFAYCRLGVGKLEDRTFARNVACARAEGLDVGAYHVLDIEGDPIEQARWACACAAYLPCTLPIALDFERGVDPRTAKWTARVSPRQAEEAAVTYLAEVQRVTSVVPIIYTGGWYMRIIGDREESPLGAWPLWLSDYRKEHEVYVPKAWDRWTLWQFDGDGGRKLTQGIECDFNWASQEDLYALTGRSVPSPFGHVEECYPLISAPSTDDPPPQQGRAR